MKAPAKLEFRVLGPIEVVLDGRPVELGGPRARQRALLGCLLAHAGEVVGRDRLIDSLWDSRPPPTAKTIVQTHVSQLRRLLEPERAKGEEGRILVTHAAGYRLEVATGSFDRDEFERMLGQGRDCLKHGRAGQTAELLGRALKLWRGPAYGDLAYEQWARNEAERLDELRRECLEERIEAELQLGRHAHVLADLEALVAEHPLRERPRAQLMLALYRSGRQAEALQAYLDARRALVDELGIEPSSELRELEAAILRQEPSLAGPAEIEAPPTNLPAPATPFLGRERELDETTRILARPDVRLLTLTGPGGVGKTRIALAVAGAIGEQFRDGVFLCELAAVRDPHLALGSISQTLAVEETGSGSPLKDLQLALRGRTLLLVLDNLEQVIDVGTSLAKLLATCPDVTLLATSRAPLHVAAEHEYPVGPLSVGDAGRLFTERARAVRPDFDGNGEVEEICERLDRLPLAIELAAARTRVLSPAAILERIEERLPLLSGGPRDVPERHQGLRAAIAWSYDLLEEDDQEVFASLSVFRGGFTMDAARAVCGASPEQIESMIEKSLIQPASDGRNAMLQTIQAFAAERLDAEGGTVRGAHALYFLGLLENGDEHLVSGTDVQLWLERFDAEYDNLQAALAWARSTRDAGLELRIATRAVRFWLLRGRLTEGYLVLSDALERASAVSPATRRDALNGVAILATARGEHGAAREAFEHALALARELDDKPSVAKIVSNLGTAYAMNGELEDALPLLEQAVVLQRELGAVQMLAGALNNLASLAGDMGDYERQAAAAAESVGAYRRAGDTEGITVALLNRGYAELEQGSLQEALESLLESLHLSRPVGAAVRVLPILSALAAVAARSGRAAAGARILGAVDAARAAGEVVAQPSEAEFYVRTEAELRQALGDEAYDAAAADGRALALDEAAELAETLVR
jgi:predicted ATPase/DNA-binding SARP family transcriptional activator